MHSQQLLLPLAAAGLLAMTLTLAGVAHRHRQQRVARRALVQRMETAIDRIEEGLRELEPLPLQPELLQLLRRDVSARYRMIGEVAPRYPDLQDRLAQAEARFRAEAGRDASSLVPAVADESHFRRLLGQLDSLKDLLENGGTFHPVADVERRSFIAHLGERSADLAFRFHHDRHKQLTAAGDPAGARVELQKLATLLEARGPATGHVRELYNAAQAGLNSAAVAPAAEQERARHAS